MKRILLFCLLAFSLASCAPVIKNITKQLPPLDDSIEVTIYDMGDSIPEHVEILGSIAILSGFPIKDNWEKTLEFAKKEARNIGGNGLDIQTHIYPYATNLNAVNQIAAFILNIDDNYVPNEPEVHVKKEFNDYVIIQEGDTIPCLIAKETNKSILFVYDYNRQGLRRSVQYPKSDLISYHIEDSLAYSNTQRKLTRELNKKTFHFRCALQGGLFRESVPISTYYDSYRGPYFTAKANLFISKRWSLGVKSNIYIGSKHGSYDKVYPYLAGNIGFHIPILTKQQRLDYYLDGACKTGQPDTQWISIEYSIGHILSHWSDKIINMGIEFIYERMVTKNFGYGIGLSFIGGYYPKGINGGVYYYL